MYIEIEKTNHSSLFISIFVYNFFLIVVQFSCELKFIEIGINKIYWYKISFTLEKDENKACIREVFIIMQTATRRKLKYWCIHSIFHVIIRIQWYTTQEMKIGKIIMCVKLLVFGPIYFPLKIALRIRFLNRILFLTLYWTRLLN